MPDPVAAAAKKQAEAEKKKKDEHNTAIYEWQRVFVERKLYLDAGIGDEFPGWKADVERLRKEQSELDVMGEAYDEKDEEIREQKAKMREKQKAYGDQCDTYDAQLLDHHAKIVLPDINDTFHHVPNWTGYKVPSKEWCEWMDGLEDYTKEKFPDAGYAAHGDEEMAWFAKMHPKKDAVPTFYPEEYEEDVEEAPAPIPASPPPPPSPKPAAAPPVRPVGKRLPRSPASRAAGRPAKKTKIARGD